jgi:predicted RNase H-like HicB family nuclease
MEAFGMARSYVVPIVIEPDEDRWSAYVPSLEDKGAVTWGATRDEAIRNIQEVAQMVVEELLADGEVLPAIVTAFDKPTVSINI